VPQAIWLTGGTPSAAAATVSTAVSAAAPGGKVTEFVVYYIRIATARVAIPPAVRPMQRRISPMSLRSPRR